MAELKNGLLKYKYAVIVLVIGLLFMLIPGPSTSNEGEYDEAVLLCQALSAAEGVGKAQVIISENGVVVVCEGANDAGVRLEILRAVRSYTGFGLDKISILRMTDY